MLENCNTINEWRLGFFCGCVHCARHKAISWSRRFTWTAFYSAATVQQGPHRPAAGVKAAVKERERERELVKKCIYSDRH